MTFPQLGSVVIYYQGDHETPHNGSRFHPAIVTRVWGQDCCNLTVFADCEPVSQIRSSATRLPPSVFAPDVYCTNSGWITVDEHAEIEDAIFEAHRAKAASEPGPASEPPAAPAAEPDTTQAAAPEAPATNA